MKKSKLQTPTVAYEDITLTLLPYDIVVDEILSRLPVKSIFRFKCVCKHWCNKLFNDLKFINSHLRKSIETGKFNCFALQGCNGFENMLTSKSASLTSFQEDYIKTTAVLDFPLESMYIEYPDMWFNTHGSCNGLILLRSGTNSRETNIFLWNPSTKEFKIIQLEDSELLSIPTYGLGYDCDTDDYKIVKATTADRDEHYNPSGTEVQVYSLNSDSWKPLPHIVPYDVDSYSYAFVNGALHWIATPCPISTPTSILIVSFDIRGENFRVVPLSPQVDELFTCPQHAGRTLGVLRGCLCVVVPGPSSIEVWVMKDHKLRDSWTQLFTAQLPVVKGKVLRDMTLQCELKNGKVLFRAGLDFDRDTYFVVYDLAADHKQAQFSEMYLISGSRYSVETYVESLVSVSGTNAGEPSLQEAEVSKYLARQKQAVSKYLNR